MKTQPYVYVDWRNIETVRDGLAQKTSLTLRALNAMDPRHRKTLMALSPAERKKLVKLDAKLASEMATAGALLCAEKKLAEGLALFDLVAASGHRVTDVDMRAGVNATYYLFVGPAELKTPERARKYIDYFGPIAATNTAILLNLAELRRDVLGEGAAAIAALRDAIELGDPKIHAQIAEDEDAWRSLPGFEALASVTPRIPVALRCLQTWNDLRVDEMTVLYDAGLAYFDLDFSRRKLSDTFYGVDDASFEVFATSEETAQWALWRRDPKAPRERSPVVVFGHEGSVGVYADSLASMMCLLGHGWKAEHVEAIGYPYGDEGWTAPKKLPKLKPIKAMLARIKEVLPEAVKLDPEKARQKALALMPELIAAATRRSKECAVRKPGTARAKPPPTQKVKGSMFEVGLAKLPETEWPADLRFLHSKKGKPWRDRFDIRLLGSKGDLPELLQDLGGEGAEDEDLETRANQRAIREVLAMVTFAIEASADNAKLYGYWRGPEKTPLHAAPVVGFDSEGTISKEVGASLLEILLQESCFDEPELFEEYKAALVQAGQKVATKKWNDYKSRSKWKSDPEKLHDALYEKYRKAMRDGARRR